MSDQPTSPDGQAQPATAAEPGAEPASPGTALEPSPAMAHNTWTPDASSSSGTGLQAKIDERPELAVGGAFASGLLLALILKRLAR